MNVAIVPDEFLLSIGLLPLTCGVLCCRDCQTAYGPSAMYNHLTTGVAHKGMSRAIDKQAFDAAIARCKIPDDMPLPPSTSPIAAIPGLATLQGLYCSHCPLTSGSHEVMRKHYNSVHSLLAAHDRITPLHGSMQQYNGGANRQWFRVHNPERSNGDPIPDDDFRRTNYHILGNKSIDPDSENNIHNVNSWLRHCQYHRHTKGLDNNEAMAYVALPTEEEFVPLNEAVDEYIRQCEEFIDVAHVNILQQLNSEDPLAEYVKPFRSTIVEFLMGNSALRAAAIRSGFNDHPFQRFQEATTMSKYKLILKRLLAMLVRLVPLAATAAEPSESHWMLHNATMDQLGGILHTWLGSGNCTAVGGADVVRKVCTLLWLRSWDSTKNDLLPDPTQRFCVLYSLRSDGSHTAPKYITKLFAQLKYLIRLHVLDCISRSDDKVQATKDFRQWYTRKESLSTFSMVCSWQKIASSQVMLDMALASVYWIDRKTWTRMSYDGDEIDLSDVQKMFHAMEDDLVRTFEDDVLLGQQFDISTVGLTESLGNRTSGYSFLDDERNTQLKDSEYALYNRIMSDEQLRKRFTVQVGNKWHWNHTRLRRWLEAHTRLAILLLLRCEMLSGGPARGTELINALFRSCLTQQVRNLSVVEKCLMLLRTYGKTTSLTGKDRLIPHALDSVTADILLRDLIIARPFACLAAAICFPNQPEVASRFRSYVFVKGTRLFTTDDITREMKSWTWKYLKIELGVQDWRHITIAWRRKLCPCATNLLENDHEDYIGVEQAGHSWKVERSIYGVSPDALAGMPEDIIPLFFIASCSWQKAMRTVPGASKAILVERTGCEPCRSIAYAHCTFLQADSDSRIVRRALLVLTSSFAVVRLNWFAHLRRSLPTSASIALKSFWSG